MQKWKVIFQAKKKKKTDRLRQSLVFGLSVFQFSLLNGW